MKLFSLQRNFRIYNMGEVKGLAKAFPTAISAIPLEYYNCKWLWHFALYRTLSNTAVDMAMSRVFKAHGQNKRGFAFISDFDLAHSCPSGDPWAARSPQKVDLCPPSLCVADGVSGLHPSSDCRFSWGQDSAPQHRKLRKSRSHEAVVGEVVPKRVHMWESCLCSAAVGGCSVQWWEGVPTQVHEASGG